MSYRLTVSERVVNIREPNAQKREYAPIVYAMIQKAYAPVGGVHGAGFASPDDMVRNIPFWKLFRSGGEIRAVLLYKMKGGRKMVTMASDGTIAGKKGLMKMLSEDILLGRSYAEISGPALTFIRRILATQDIRTLLVPIETVRRVRPQDEIRPVQDEQDPELAKHPDLREFFYSRVIGDTWHTKVMIGNPS